MTRLGAVQATVRSFSAESRSGTVLTDDGTELPYGPDAFDRSGLRLLRFGQRVRITVGGRGPDRRVTTMTVVTLR